MNTVYVVDFDSNVKVDYVLNKNEVVEYVSSKDFIRLLKEGATPELLLILSSKKQFELVMDFMSHVNRCSTFIRMFPIYYLVTDADFSSFYNVGKFPYVQLPSSEILFRTVKLAFMSGIDAIDSSIEALRQYGQRILFFYRNLRRLQNMYEVTLRNGISIAVEDYLVLLAELVETYDGHPVDHVKRSGRLAYEISIRNGFSEKEAKEIAKAVKIHDIGKLFIPKELLGSRVIIQKEEDLRIFYEHTRKGASFLRRSLQGNSAEISEALIEKAIEVVSHHHENFDGSGYPGGLKQHNIPFEARVTKVIDVFDSLTRKRPYRAIKLSDIETVELMKESKGQFDPDVLRALEETVRASHKHYTTQDRESVMPFSC